MGFNLEEWTVRVLEGGLPPLPARLEPGQTVPVALWRGKRFGAVLFVRLWKNGNVDSDCAITRRAEDGSWKEPDSYGGSGWIDDPLVRSTTGWDGDPVAWVGEVGHGFGVEDESDAVDEPAGPDGLAFFRDSKIMYAKQAEGSMPPSFDDEPWAGLDVRALLGAASTPVAAIEVRHARRTWRVPIESPCGAFIVGLEAPGPATLRVLDHDGRPLADADGASERVA